MMDRRPERELGSVPGVVFGLAGALATASMVAFAAFTAPQPADALPAYAQQTGLACGRCHVNPAGGGARTAFGNTFAANGHKVPSGAKASKSEKTGATGGAPAAPSIVPPPPLTYPGVTAYSGSYYSPVVNPHFGYVPELSYSNAVDFKLYPLKD